jgi:EmrB/QacA subfamily drug resistance transporter
MVILDVTIVNVALPSIGDELGFSPAHLQWVITAYVLFTGGLMLLGGRAGDLLGRRRVLLTGLALFTTASLASGLAASPSALIVARAVQGIGAAMLVPSALSIVTTTYSGHARAVALAVWGAVGSAGAAVGVLLGGVLTTLLGWESIFLINVPVGIATAIATVTMIPGDRPGASAVGRFDITGAITVMGGLLALVYSFDHAAQHGWGATTTLAPLALSIGLFAAFAVLERRSASPLIPPATWAVRSLVASAAVMLIATGLLVGAFFLNTIYLQHVLDATALETGLAFLPFALVIGAGAHFASRALPRIGSRYVAITGLALMAVGAATLAAAPDRAAYGTDLLPGFLVLGAGVGMVFVAMSVTAMADVSHEGAGLASGLMTTAHELGAALGVAVLSAVAASATSAAGSSFASGYEDGFIVSAVVAAVLAVVAAVAVPAVRPAAGARIGIH